MPEIDELDGGEFGDSSEDDSLKEFSISFVMACNVAGLGRIFDEVSSVSDLKSISDGFDVVILLVTVTVDELVV